MSTGPIRAVLFDFGGTLFDYADLTRGQMESIVALGERLGLAATPAELAAAQRRGTSRVFRDYLERTYYLHEDFFADALHATAAELGIALSPEDAAFYFATQHRNRARDFRLRQGVHETVDALRARGLHLGIVSNIDEADLHHLIDLGGLRERFDSLLSSEAARSCKPDRRIFEIALERAGCAPGEALFVGDTLAQDVAGANRFGMRSVLLWHRDDRQPPENGARPHHVIRAIPELLALIEPGRG
jgi:putative hydrolase of the HAD superfamily